jgi:PEGA domain-containing protein
MHAALLFLVPLLHSADPGPKTSVLVLDLDAVGVSADLALQVRRFVAESIGKRPEYTVLTLEDVKDILSHEQSKQIVGCQSETSCVVEKTKAVNSDLAVKGSVGLVGKSISVSLSLIDEKKVSVRNRIGVLAEKAELLHDTVEQGVRELFGWSSASAKTSFKLPKNKKTSFAVFDLVASGVAPDVAVNLTQILSVEIKRAQGASVIGRDDIKAMLALETQKQLIGCSDDTSCLSEIGAALGVDYLVVGHVGKVSGTYVISLRLIAPDALRVENRVTESFSGREDQLVGAVKHAGRKLVGIINEEKGTLALGANEEDAEAFLDGASVGVLPMKPLAGIEPGRHTVRIAKSGYFDWNGDVYVDPAAATVLWADLEKRPREWYETWWFWTMAGVVAVGTGTAIGIGLANRSSDANRTYPFAFETSLPQR